MAKKPIPTQTPVSKAPSGVSDPLQKPEAELPYAIIQYAANNSVLYPMDAIDGTTAKLTLSTGATNVIFYMAIKGQDEPVFEPVPVAPGIDVVDIRAQLISYCIGHTVLIKYTAVEGGVFKESLVLELEVQQIREEHLVVSRPVFKHAKPVWGTLTLNMSDLVDGPGNKINETVEVEAWPLIYEGQRLFIIVAGNQHIPPYRFIWVAFDHVVQASEAHAGHVFRFSLSRAWLSRLADYSAITVHHGVIWDKTAPVLPEPGDPLIENPLPVNAQDFHLRTTSLLRVDSAQDLPPPHLLESVELPPGHWQVNPTNTVNGGHVIVAYEGMTEGDHVCVYASDPDLGSVPLGCKDVQAGETSLSFEVAPEIIAALFNKTMTLKYSLQFDSYQPQYSPDRVIKVLGPQLSTPGIEQATGPVVDLNTFSGNATGLVPVWNYAAEGQCCWMWLTGMLADGSPYRFDVLMGEPLTAHWLANGVDTAILRNELKKLADCSDVDLHFAASFDGKCDRASAIEFPSKSFSIALEHWILRAPQVTEAVGNDLTVWNGRDGVHVEVEYEGSNPDHTLSVCWNRPNGSCWPLGSQPGSASGAVRFFLPREAVIESIGKTVKIEYTVSNACKVQTSDDLNLTISVPVRLPTPVVEQATPRATQNGILDLRTFAGDADITVEKWWFILLGQVGWLECTGIAENGSAHTIKVSIAEPVTQSEVSGGLKKLLKRAELEKLRDRTSLVVAFKATPDVGGVLGNAIAFATLHLQFRKALYDHTDFNLEDKGWNGWNKGPGATSPADLVIKPGAVPGSPNGHYLQDWGYTNTSDPATQRVKLYKDFTELEVGRTYRFSAWVRDIPELANRPRLVIVAQGQEISPVTLPTTSWHLLQGTFKANSSTARLSLDNLQMGIGPGNDYDVTGLTVAEV
ncbi:carbohydrate binding domain-containing protein [Pseudomonas sp. TAE6080]|uniref:hypothetical protein n=1 Tax=Pseudomonas sp. TAE6080 TaxID=2840374 RepID=UPI001C003885|nr:hypothetical protein [Pseudomonas sp. TAE6080]MBT9300752.1 hypothetical protein [Pseudomonas sp. TAE6080]